MHVNIEQYIKKHNIPKHKLYSDLLFEDWDEFLTVLYENGGRVEGVLWWDYCRIEEQYKSLGGGGYKDPKNPEYMWAETMIWDNVSDKTVDEIRAYIRSTMQQYKPHHLYPSFFLPHDK